MSDPMPRVRAPQFAAAGETVVVKTLIRHPMETGLRPDRDTGALTPRHIIERFIATFDGAPVIDIDVGASVAANPYIEFALAPHATGVLRLEWRDDRGAVYVAERTITVV